MGHQHLVKRAGLGVCVGAVALIAAACGQGSSSTQTPAQILAAGAKAMQGLKSFHVSGAFEVNTESVILRASVRSSGESSGNIIVGPASANFVQSQGTLYLDTLNALATGGTDAGTLSIAMELKGTHWWQTPGGSNLSSALAVLQPSNYQTLFFGGRGALTQTATKDTRGRAAIKVSDGMVAVFLTPDATHNVLEITTAPHTLSLNLSNVDLVYDGFSAPVTVTPPPSPVTLTPEGLPPLFQITSIDSNGDCDSAGCPLKAGVTTLVGSGAGTIDFSVLDSGGSTLASCSAPVTVPSVGGSATASCKATGSAWTNWFYNIGGTYKSKAAPENPDYTTP